MHKHGGYGNASCASAKCKASSASCSWARQLSLDNCHTCFKSLVVSRFERSENFALHLYSSIVSAAAIPAIGGVACGTDMGLKFIHCICICTCAYSRDLNLQEQWRACLQLVTLSWDARFMCVHCSATYKLIFMLVPLIISILSYIGFQYSVSNATAYASLLAFQLHYCDIILTR